MTAIRDLMFLLPILLLHAVEGSLGDEIDRTISEEEFHLSKDVVSFAQKKKPDRRLQGQEDDEDDNFLHVNFLTACVTPFRTYVPSEDNMFRVPYGNVRITFDGGQGIFNNITRGEYPGYDPNLEFTFQYDLQGLPGNCEKCRIQVNEGETCDEPGIRFWDRSVEGAENPWRQEWGAVYNSNKHGQSRGYFSMFDGFEFDDHKTRSVVVFAEDAKTRLGCGVIRRKNFGECGNDPPTPPTAFPSRSPITITFPPNVMPVAPPPTPTTFAPSAPIDPDPTFGPAPTAKPTGADTARPTPDATARPTPPPTPQPTPQPTERPTPEPTPEPTPQPTERPTPQATERPTPEATARPTPHSTYRPTEKPPTYDPPTYDPPKGKGGKAMGPPTTSSSSDSKKSGKMTKRRRTRYTRGMD